jgi:hypothetical protein
LTTRFMRSIRRTSPGGALEAPGSAAETVKASIDAAATAAA